MTSKNYKKKPITGKVRPCALPGCEVTFEPNRADQKYCCRKHNEKHWHLTHPRVYKSSLPPSESAYEICGRDNMKRDTPKTWVKYMRVNPCYLEGLGKFTNGVLNVLKNRLYA